MSKRVSQERINRAVRHIEIRYASANAWKDSNPKWLKRAQRIVAAQHGTRPTNRQWDQATQAERSRLENRLRRINRIATDNSLRLPRLESRQLWSVTR